MFFKTNSQLRDQFNDKIVQICILYFLSLNDKQDTLFSSMAVQYNLKVMYSLWKTWLDAVLFIKF